MNFYLGYKLSPSFDIGLTYAFSPFNSQSSSGADYLGASAQRNESNSLSIVGVEANYKIFDQGPLSMSLVPMVGYGQYNLSESISSSNAQTNLTANASGVVAKIGISTDYQLNKHWRLRLETGYLWANSGPLTITSQNGQGQTVGQSYQASTGNRSNVNENLSGSYVGLGVAFDFSLFNKKAY